MLDSLHIKNFRCFEDLTIPSLGRVNLIVGKNNSGKSTLLDALYLYANGCNIWAIQNILSGRNEYPKVDTNQQFNTYLAQSSNQARMAFDSLRNIFNRNISKNPNENYGIIETSHATIKMEMTNDIDTLKKENGISTQNHWQNRVKLEGFLVTLRTSGVLYYVESTPASIINDLSAINPGTPHIKSAFIETNIGNEQYLASTWGQLQNTGDDFKINEALKIIEPRTLRTFFTVDEKIAKINLQGITEAQTLKSMGEGMMRLFQILIYAYSSRSGFLIIDEIENGLHYSIQEEVWDKLFKLAKELDIQVFATTHSEDTVKAFCKVALASEEEGRLIALGRSPAPEDNARIVAVSYDEKEIAVISRTGMEVR
jgi:AAA15 family ATPase/GTPase